VQYGIDVTLICDSAAGYVMGQGMIDCVITGADRIALNGDTANKIGTFSLSVLAKYHNIPFYIAAPFTTFDIECKNGSSIIIEERPENEVTECYGKRIAPSNVKVFNPAFDITPAVNITAFVTDKGLIYPPFGENIKSLFQ
jgi:methylthioribose-1-phosphate isomerase